MDALCAIPDNWRRVALATDLRLPPEYIPGIELAAKQNRYDFGDYVLSPRNVVPRRARIPIALGQLVGAGRFISVRIFIDGR
jgi:hypothetical protein